MLNGKKVLLRPIKRTDISLFLKWFNDPEVTQYLALYLPMTEMAEEKWIEENTTNRPDSDIVFVIEAINSGISEAIGSAGLNRLNLKDREGTLGIAIGEKDYWGQGYGTEAVRLILNYGFEQMNLHRIVSSVYAFNRRSLNMHRNVGFVEEGKRRNARFKNGQYWDKIEFGILDTEWKSLAINSMPDFEI
jgi:RimJ/RimL family protein N-acetyltransferase